MSHEGPKQGQQEGGYAPPGCHPPPGCYPQVEQPAQLGGLMPLPAGPPGCPEGLQYLTQLDQLVIHQKVDLVEAFTGFEKANKYTVKNSLGQQVYFAAEDTGIVTRHCCGGRRPFDLKVMDHTQREVVHLERPLRCQGSCFPCCLQELEVFSASALLGKVKQNWTLCKPSFDVLNDAGSTVLKIQGPACTIGLCGDVVFDVLSADGRQKVGKITKRWVGLTPEAISDADNFGISFPKDLDVKVKATMLGAAFLIDFMFFES